MKNSRKISEIDFPSILGALQGEVGETQESLAQKLLIDRSYVSMLLRGKKAPSPRLAERIVTLARESGVTLSQETLEVFPHLRELPMRQYQVVRESQGSFKQRQPQVVVKPYPTITKEPTREDVLKLVHRYLDDAEEWPGGIASAYHKLRLACDPRDFDYNPADYGDLPEKPE